MSHPSSRPVDESPVRLDLVRSQLPSWLQRYLPTEGGDEHDEHGKGMFGFIVFLLSESMVFASFFLAYLALRLTTQNWLPQGISGLEVKQPAINTVVLVSSSFVIYFAEKALKRNKIGTFRFLWLLTSAMGTYFLLGQWLEWSSLPFKITTGLFGTTFYLLTGFHGLHVLAGVLLQLLMFGRSFLPGAYSGETFGISATSLFWHFVDVIWLLLFFLLYLWQP
jgi:cytochrome c oxidase subunit III